MLHAAPWSATALEKDATFAGLTERLVELLVDAVDGGVLVRDVRGMPCTGELMLLDGVDVMAIAKLDDNGVVAGNVPLDGSVRFALRLPGSGVRPVQASGKAASFDVPKGQVQVRWQLVGGVTLRLELLEKAQGTAKIRVHAAGAGENVDWLRRLRIVASNGEARVAPHPGGVMVRIVGRTTGDSSLVATDGPTGVSAWMTVQ